MRKTNIWSFITILFLLTGFTPAYAATSYVQLSGILTDSSGTPVNDPSAVQVPIGVCGKVVNGVYSCMVPANQFTGVTFIFRMPGWDTPTYSEDFANIPPRADVPFSTWTTSVTLTQDTVINFQLPKPINITVSTVDASDNPLGQVVIDIIGADPGDETHDPMKIGNYSWIDSDIGESKYSGVYTSSGRANLTLYPETKAIILYQLGKPAYMADRIYGADLATSGSIKICVPINFGSNRTLPADCIQNIHSSAVDQVTPTPTPTPSSNSSTSTDSAAENQIADLTSQLNAVKAAAASAATTAANQIADLTSQLNAANTATQNAASNAAVQLNSDSVKITSLTTQVASLTAQLTNLQTNLAKLNTLVASQAKQLRTICSNKPKPRGC